MLSSSRKNAKKLVLKAKKLPYARFSGYPIKTKAVRKKSTATKKENRMQHIMSAIFSLACGFVFGYTSFPFSVYPVGTAFIIASGKYTFFSYIGASLAAIFCPSEAAAIFAINSLAFFSRGFMTSYNFDDSIPSKIAVSTLLSVVCSAIFVLSGSFSGYYLSKALCFLISVPSITFAFLSVTKFGKNPTINGSFCAACFVVVFVLSQVPSQKFFPSVFLSSFIILFSALGGGAVYGLLLGLVCGIACTGQSLSASIALPMGIAGFFAGICGKQKKAGALMCFSFVFVLVFLYTHSIYDPLSVALSAVSGAILFLPASDFLPKLFVNEKTVIFGGGEKTSKKYEKISHALSKVSDIVYNVSDKLKYPSEHEIRESIRHVTSAFCSDCAMCERCYSRKLYEKENVEDIVCLRLSSGGLDKKDLPEKYADSCIRLSEMVDKLNDSYARLVNDRFRDNKTEILASEYSSMARLIKYTSQKEKADNAKDELLEERARKALAAIGVRFSSVQAYGTRIKTVDVLGVKIDKFPCSSIELADYMSEKCGYLFSEPEYIGCGEKMIMRMKRRRKIKLEYARSACAKGGNSVNGDSVNFFESDEHYFYALISDGMGSGRSAALTSRLTSIFLEKLLTTGTHKNVTLELLNNLLLSKNDESFATVDLLEVDLLTGDALFIKAGAAPAYIVRASKLYKIASYTPPAGIIRSFNAESTKFTLEKGDSVLMLSDGIVQSSDDAPWLCEMLSFDNTDDPARLSEKILSKARKINLREDDMTCVAVTVV